MNKQEFVVSQELPIDPESKTKSAYQDIREKPQGDEAPDLQLSRRTDPALGREIDVQSWTGLPLLRHYRDFEVQANGGSTCGWLVNLSVRRLAERLMLSSLTNARGVEQARWTLFIFNHEYTLLSTAH
jgi:hypothetical protein